jgi:type IV secretion system protein VirD4
MYLHSEPNSVIRELDDALRDPAGLLHADASALLDRFPAQQLEKSLEHLLKGKPFSLLQHLAYEPFEAAGSASGAARLLLKSFERGREMNKRRTLVEIMRSYTLARPTIALEDREKGFLRSMAALWAERSIKASEFEAFIAEFCWHKGECVIVAPPAASEHALEPQARKYLGQLLQLHLRPYDQFLAATAAKIAMHRDTGLASGDAIKNLLNQGSSWGELDDSDTFGLEQEDASLLVGFTGPNRMPVYYGHDESLITIAGPGTGKSQVQVIPNLICYPGSAFVLDVKGELWTTTAGHRAKHYGPVYRFAPTDLDGETHCYNPFEFVSNDPHRAATDCELISSQIIPTNASLKDPFWDGRARDFLWTFAMATVLSEPLERRNLATIMEMLSVPICFNRPDDYKTSTTAALVARLRVLAERFDIPALAESATAIESGLNDRMDSVFDTARRYLTIFSRSARLRHAMSRSDWSPLDLRRQPGSTVYLCLSGDDIETYQPIVRLILQQHATMLLSSPRVRGHPPVTFFLDEFPQLGRMESIQRLMDVGRGAGLRLWLFAQYIGQLHDEYQTRANGLIQACRVRCFMQPDNDAANMLMPQLGKVEHLFSGKDKPLAEPYQLMGRAFADKIIVTARGHEPVLLGKRYAWQEMPEEMSEAPPAINLRLPGGNHAT